MSSNLTFNYGLRYEYYTPLSVRDNLVVKFNIDTGRIDPNTTQLHGTLYGRLSDPARAR